MGEMGEMAASAMHDTVGPLVNPDDLAAHYWDMYIKPAPSASWRRCMRRCGGAMSTPSVPTSGATRAPG
ncbi:hypothetical protein ACTWPT_33745 [Nonomuraea sp. 3N208]|uniref:hypothetical protein n=1 Tax=Nonomuraea sp. 3N208 TaxID=3457421 RepID=UPI003FD495E3